MAYQAHENVDLVLEGLVVLNLALLHGLNSHFHAYENENQVKEATTVIVDKLNPPVCLFIAR